jgi:hypothetical protein
MMMEQPRWLQRPLSPLSGRRRLVVVVIKKEPNQLYGAVETVEGLDTTRERAKKIQRHLLSQVRARRT